MMLIRHASRMILYPYAFATTVEYILLFIVGGLGNSNSVQEQHISTCVPFYAVRMNRYLLM